MPWSLTTDMQVAARRVVVERAKGHFRYTGLAMVTNGDQHNAAVYQTINRNGNGACFYFSSSGSKEYRFSNNPPKYIHTVYTCTNPAVTEVV